MIGVSVSTTSADFGDTTVLELMGRWRSVRSCAIQPPRLTLRVVLAAAAVGGMLAVVLPLSSRWGLSWLAAMCIGGQLLVALSVARSMWRMAALQTGGAEADIWRWFALAVMALALAGTAHQLGSAGLIDQNLGVVFDFLGVVGVCASAYQGVIWWNRVRTRVSDPGDWLNGVSATCAAAALGDLVLHWHGTSLLKWSEVQTQSWLVGLGALVVFLGAVPPIALMANLGRDRRLWSVSVGVAVGAGGCLSVPFADRVPAVTDAAWFAGMLLIAWAATSQGSGRAPRPATTQATTVGALVVLAVGVLILAVDSEFAAGSRGATVVFALLAVTGVSARGAQLIRDLSLLAQTRQEALTDELTGIANRRGFMRQLLTEEQVDSRALLVVDLDGFKEVNDRLGHQAGDELLRVISARFAATLRPGHFLARLGGDEFAVLIGAEDVEEAEAVAQRLITAAGQPVWIDGRQVQVSASIGGALSSGLATAVSGRELLRRADAAMYEAKSGHTGYAAYDRRLDAERDHQAELTQHVRSVLAGPRHSPRGVGPRVFYQPKVDLRTGTVTGVEALVRWQHPELGLLPPAEFLEVIEAGGLMFELTERVLNTAVRDARRWYVNGWDLRLSVNVATSSLTDPRLLDVVTAAIEASGRPAARLVLEVTETDVMADPMQSIAMLQKLADRGVGISIDDYGTGYSSLAYLNDLPATELKLDRAFTKGLVSDARTAHIVAGTIALAHRLDLRLVAEGVEDEVTLQALRSLGCDETQGFFHLPAVPAEQLLQWLSQRQQTSSPGPVAAALRPKNLVG